MIEAMFWQAEENGAVLCQLCPKYCTIPLSETGFCRVRKNVEGKLYTTNYGQLSANDMDPIEKKPLYHFYPGHYTLSLGTFGCNLRCGFCQNWNIAQETPQTIAVTPEQVVEVAANQKVYPNIGIAYTYSEPLVWYEFIFQTVRLAARRGLKNVLVTNGYINEEPLLGLLPYIDAMNIDVKGFTDQYYTENCAGHLAPVKRTVELAQKHCHVELTNLLIPGRNDSEAEIRALVDWVAGIDPQIPLHFSRYFPHNEYTEEATPPETLKRAREIAQEKLQYVYIGNLGEAKSVNTYCPQCGRIIVNRTWHNGKVVGLTKEHCCKDCGQEILMIRENKY